MKKTQQLSELRQLSKEALVEKITGLEKNRLNLRFRHASGQLEKSSELGNLQKEIARAKTILRGMERV